MARVPEPLPALVLAAQELEDEIRRCEESVAEAAKMRLNSEKNLGRAARALQAATEHRDRMGEKVNALLAAINAARGRAETAAARMETRAGEIQARMERLKSLQARVNDIADAVRDVTAAAKQAATARDILMHLGPVEARVAQTHQEARADEFDDVAADIDALRQMLASLRKKIESI
jgi:chromosome segregation ATPase